MAAQIAALGHEVIEVKSAAPDRATYLKRPDLGRMLNDAARGTLAERARQAATTYDVVVVIADGLSARAVERHAGAVLERTAPALGALDWHLAPVVVVTHGRVAVGDEIGDILHAEQVAVLIGERPGLSVADSLGVYLTYAPRPGRTDAERNCISNIHAHGLSYDASAHTLLYLMTEARRLKLTGVELKDNRQGLDTAQVTD
jgi:ethanolamine ammonia-lyase small subunit